MADETPNDGAAELDAAAAAAGLNGAGGPKPGIEGEWSPKDEPAGGPSADAREWAATYSLLCAVSASVLGEHWKADPDVAVQIGEAASETFPDTGVPPWLRLTALLCMDLGVKYAMTAAAVRAKREAEGEAEDPAAPDPEA